MRNRLFAAFTVFILIFALNACGAPAATIQPENRAPGFELANLQGETVSLDDFRGRPVLLNFWTLSCPYCLDEMPYFQAIHEKYGSGPNGLAVVTINLRNAAGSVTSFIHNGNYTFETLLDTTSRVGSLYGVRGVPVTVFIDNNGIIRDVVIGAFPNTEALENRLQIILP